MEVTCTIEAPDGGFSYVTETASTYDEGLNAARAKVPDGSRMIAIRTVE
ncbi:hypothetical protein [Arthrobacter sp. FW306-2-2C-D06B]|nr:hypothetical protein [Arthrobacter sp. FW306-2-2C-D06B]UKA59137.1 hypothetical protein LFT47_01930 [Arthrobacter sp. FW306-2-2C-D06B]